MSLRDEILSKTTLPTEAVFVPEWGTTVYVRTMPSTEKTAFEVECIGPKGTPRDDALRAVKERLLSRTIVDENGVRIFGDDDMDAIGQLHPLAVDRVFRVAQRLNLEVGDAEELAKNSGGTQG